MGYLDNEFRQAFRNLMWPERIRGLDIDKWVAYCASTGATTVFLDLKTQAYALYGSQFIATDPACEGRDFAAELSDAARKRGLKWCAYIAPCELESGKFHPEWQQRLIDGSPAAKNWGFWKTIYCWNSPFRDLLCSILREIAERYHPHGFYLDLNVFDFEGCYCAHCAARFQKEYGLPLPKPRDWNSRGWHLFLKARREWLADTARATSEAIHGVDKEISIVTNSHFGATGWHAAQSPEQASFSDFICAEIPDRSWLPDGVSMGDHVMWFCAAQRAAKKGKSNQIYSYFTPSTRIDDMELLADLAAAAGAALCVQEHRPDMRRVFDRLQEIEPYLVDATPIADIAVHYSETVQPAYYKTPTHNRNDPFLQEVRGVYRAVLDSRRPVGVLTDDDLSTGDYRDALLIILPNSAVLPPPAAAHLRRHLEKGGAVIASMATGTLNEFGETISDELLWPSSGLANQGPIKTRKPFWLSTEDGKLTLEESIPAVPDQYLVFKDGTAQSWLGEDISVENHPEPIEAKEKLQLHAGESIHLPIDSLSIAADDNWHVHATLAFRAEGSTIWSETPAILSRRVGDGMLIYAAFQMGTLVSKTGHPWWSSVLHHLVAMAIGDSDVKIEAPLCVKTSFWRQKGKTLIHLVNELSSSPSPKSPMRDRLPVTARIRLSAAAFTSVRIAIGGYGCKTESRNNEWLIECNALRTRMLIVCE